MYIIRDSIGVVDNPHRFDHFPSKLICSVRMSRVPESLKKKFVTFDNFNSTIFFLSFPSVSLFLNKQNVPQTLFTCAVLYGPNVTSHLPLNCPLRES